jgi:hypothetical protein
MIYIYKTRVCVWAIAKKIQGWELRWYFSGGFEISGHYTHPATAADDVANSATGFYEWDVLQHGSEIADISNWQQVKSYP